MTTFNNKAVRRKKLVIKNCLHEIGRRSCLSNRSNCGEKNRELKGALARILVRIKVKFFGRRKSKAAKNHN
jgi:protein tyrosine phosphatase